MTFALEEITFGFHSFLIGRIRLMATARRNFHVDDGATCTNREISGIGVGRVIGQWRALSHGRRTQEDCNRRRGR